MSTVERSRVSTLPALIAGQRLDQPTFHERYEAMPPETRAELVGGVVYMPSPMRRNHGTEGRIVAGWLFYYQLKTPGVEGADGATVKLDQQGEPQPDCQLHIAPELGGQIRYDPEGYFAGAPELIIEIARSSRAFDLARRRPITSGLECRNTSLWSSTPTRSTGSSAATIASKTCLLGRRRLSLGDFPGLWLDPAALYSESLDRLIEVLRARLGDSRTRGVSRRGCEKASSRASGST